MQPRLGLGLGPGIKCAWIAKRPTDAQRRRRRRRRRRHVSCCFPWLLSTLPRKSCFPFSCSLLSQPQSGSRPRPRGLKSAAAASAARQDSKPNNSAAAFQMRPPAVAAHVSTGMKKVILVYRSTRNSISMKNDITMDLSLAFLAIARRLRAVPADALAVTRLPSHELRPHFRSALAEINLPQRFQISNGEDYWTATGTTGSSKWRALCTGEVASCPAQPSGTRPSESNAMHRTTFSVHEPFPAYGGVFEKKRVLRSKARPRWRTAST